MRDKTKIGRRGLLAAGTAALALPRPALAQGGWPGGRPVEVIVGFAPGGGTDVMVRALGLFLAAVGLYGVIAFTVSRRTHELGIRMAVGAGGHDIIRLVLRQGFKLGLIGLGIGFVGALIVGYVIRAALYDISPLDPIALAVSFVVLFVTAMSACYLPARRAAKIDPMEALRYE